MGEEKKEKKPMKKILFIVGSLRKGSFNRQMAQVAESLLKGKAEVSYLEYASIPYMNQDEEVPTPKEIERVRKEALDSDAIWIFTPEYNYYFPGLLKNLLDWLSRPLKPGDFSSGTAVKDKPVTISGVGGKNATSGARENLAKLLNYMRMKVMAEPQTGAVLPASAWASGIYEPDEETMGKLGKQAEEFLLFIGE